MATPKGRLWPPPLPPKVVEGHPQGPRWVPRLGEFGDLRVSLKRPHIDLRSLFMLKKNTKPNVTLRKGPLECTSTFSRPAQLL